VSSVDTIVYFGIKRLRIKFLDFVTNEIGDIPIKDTIEWIEGIGSKQGLLTDSKFYGYSLLCFKKNDTIKFKNDLGYDCSYKGPINSVIELENTGTQIYPNPVHDKVLNIQSQFEIKNIMLYDIYGKKVDQYFPRSNTLKTIYD